MASSLTYKISEKKWKIANVRPEKSLIRTPKTATYQEIQRVTTQLCLQNKATLLIRGTKGELKDDKYYTFIQHSFSCHLSSVQFSRSVVSDSLRPNESQHTRPPCPSPTPGVHPDSRPLSQWCHPASSSSVVPFSFCPQCFPASESFPMSQLFTWGGQRTGFSALASFLPKKSQGWSSSEWTGWISLQSKGLSRVFSNTRVQKHQFFGAQPSSQSNSHYYTLKMNSSRVVVSKFQSAFTCAIVS